MVEGENPISCAGMQVLVKEAKQLALESGLPPAMRDLEMIGQCQAMYVLMGGNISMHRTLSQFVSALEPDWSSEWAWFQYKATILRLVEEFQFTSLLEVGGGRCPMFSAEEIAALNVSYTINDIDQGELDFAPDYTHKQCFDIAGPGVPVTKQPVTKQYDLIFSRYVFEHLKDTQQAYKNIYALLKPGGVCLNYHPCLYALPFVLNKLIPAPAEIVSAGLLRAVYGKLDRAKFPARYSWCFATDKAARMLNQIGFQEVEIIPFYGHNYYRRIPIVRNLHTIATHYIAKAKLRSLASFAFTMVRA